MKEKKILDVQIDKGAPDQEKYELLKEEGKLFFVCREVSTDREWLNVAAKNFLKERKIEIPSKYSILISTVM